VEENDRLRQELRSMSQQINHRKPGSSLEKLQQDKFALEQKVNELKKALEEEQKKASPASAASPLDASKLRRENARLKSDLAKMEEAAAATTVAAPGVSGRQRGEALRDQERIKELEKSVSRWSWRIIFKNQLNFNYTLLKNHLKDLFEHVWLQLRDFLIYFIKTFSYKNPP